MSFSYFSAIGDCELPTSHRHIFLANALLSLRYIQAILDIPPPDGS